MKHYFLLIAVLTLSFMSKGQTDSLASASTDSTVRTSTFTLGLSAASNANYYGQKSIEATPYIAAVASWRRPSGFYINALTYRLLKNAGDGFASAYGAGTGFDIDLKKGWRTEIGYSYTYFPKNSPMLQAANPHTATLAIAHEGDLNTKLEGNYNFGHTNDFFATFGLGKAITLTGPSYSNALVFTPVADITGGTQRFYSYYLTGKNIRDSLADMILDPIFGNDDQDDQTDTTITTTTNFNILSYNLTLPLAYQWKSCLFEFTTQLSLLSKQTRSKPGELNIFFTASFYYQL